MMIIKKIKENWQIYIVILVSLILHILAIKELGFDYTLNSDDMSYIKSGITFLETGKITMHGVISAQIMPGMTFLISFFALFFGIGNVLIIALKIFWMLMGLCTIIVVYKIIRLYANKNISAFACLLFLATDYIWMDNIILTETPFILFFSLLIYHSLKLANNKSQKDYIFVIVYYILALFMRPNIGIFPIFLAIFLLLKKYNFKLLIKQGITAGIIIILLLSPWTYRNFKLFGKFIPLTYGVGNPLLLGTYQGYNYPLDDELDYQTNVDNKMPKKMKYYLENPKEQKYLTKYYSLEYDSMKAKYRMQEWWKKDKVSMLKSYLLYKPYVNVYGAFYWHPILNVKTEIILLIRRIELIIFFLCTIIIFIDKKKIKEWFFIMTIYLSQVALYSYTFALNRYAITMFFLRYIIIGIGLQILFSKIKNRSGKFESVNDNTSI